MNAQPLSQNAPDDFSKAREAMVVSQLQPSGIVSEAVLNAYRNVPRENFIPRDRGSACYCDETLDLGNGNYLLEPLIHGLLIEHATIQPTDYVLVLGDSTGYTAAILRELTSNVSEQPVDGQLYNVIIMNGAIAIMPNTLSALLAVGGRLSCVLRPDIKQVGRVCIYTKTNETILDCRPIKDENAPYIKGYEPQQKFSF
jgi:protein-L-isoaspartate(D-aspartate) O-methyltransferase